MVMTTVNKVKAIASNLANLYEETVQMYIDDAVIEMQDLTYDEKYEEKIMRYLAAHYGTIDHPKVTAEKLDGLGSQNFATRTGTKDLELTEYGIEVQRLLKKSSGLNFMVIS